VISISALYTYPVKSCRGISSQCISLDRRGPLHDRRWMLVDERGRFVSQRSHSQLALVQVSLGAGTLLLEVPGAPSLALPLAGLDEGERSVVCWSDTCRGMDQGEEPARWFQKILGEPVRLVRMADDFERRVDPRYAVEPALTGFTDGFPLLLLGEASLEDLNRRLETPLPMNRFRPNLVVSGCEPYAEDRWKRIRVAGIELEVCKPCVRCAVTTTDQETGERGSEPLATLARYRRSERGVVFGQNLVHRGEGSLARGDEIEILD
jgi:uncharacterized protein YcbX